MKGGFEGWLLGAVVWVLASTEIYFCDKSEVGCECEQALDSQLTPKSRALPPPPSTSPAAVTAPVVHILRRVRGPGRVFRILI
jgi:hypothetical protein